MPTGAPQTFWRAYMGARPTAEWTHFPEGSKTALGSFGGRVVAKHLLSQHLAWASEQLGDPRIADVVDLDGDGQLEVVVHTTPGAFVLDFATGATLWRSPADQFLFLSRVTAVDLDGDQLPEVYLDECSGCGKAGPMTAGAFSFKAGVASGAALWTRSAAAEPLPRHSGTDGVFDLDADGVSEVLLGSVDGLAVLRGNDGTQLAYLKHPSSSHFFVQAYSWAAELDGKPGQELVAVQPAAQLNFSGPPGVVVYSIDPVGGQASTMWSASAGGYEAEVVSSADVLSDVDGDGRSEVIFSWRPDHSSSLWTTRLLDGVTGAVRAELAGARFEGAADLDGQPGAEVVIATSQGVQVWKAAGTGLGALTPVLPGVRALHVADRALRNRTALNRRLAVLNRKPFPARLVVGVPSSPVAVQALGTTSSFKSAQQVSISGGSWVLGETYSPLVGEITEAIPAHHTTRPYEQLAFGTSNGTVDVLDFKMHVTNGITKVSGQRVGTLLGGATSGGFTRGGNLIAEDAGGPFVVLPDSARGLWVGDAAAASWVSPPPARWLQPGLHATSIIELGAMGTGVVGVEGHSLVARRSSDGFELGRVELGPGVPIAAPMPIRTTKPMPLVGIDWRITGVQAVQHAVDFATLTEPWSAAPLPYGGYFGSSVGDVDGDGIDEWYSMNGPLNRRNISTGALDKFASLTTAYSLPMLAPFSGESSELLLQSGGGSPKLVSSSMNLVWAGATPEPVYGIAGARVTCGSHVRFVTSAVNSPVLRAYDGKTGAIVTTRVFGSGKSYASLAAAEADSAKLGFLSNVSAVTSVGVSTGAVFVGSTEGRLYAADACDLSVLWSIDLEAPVGEPSIGDYDGDGVEELVVGTAAGFAYGIDWPSLAQPKVITLGGAGASGPVTVQPGQGLEIAWEAVPGAIGYEVALVSPDETAVWDPPYRSVTGTSTTVELDEGLADRPYRVAVRALGASAKSADALSGVFSIDDSTPPSGQVVPSATKGKVNFTLSASDELALDRFLLWWRTTDSTESTLATDGLLKGKQAGDAVKWTVPESAYGKQVEWTFEVIDSGENVSKVVLAGLVGNDGSVLMLGASSSADPSGSGLSDPGAPPAAPSGGSGESPALGARGGCGVAGGGSGDSWVIALLALALGGARRRRSR
ncbi:MAG: hypothetical protein KJ015_19485 [Myxococcales bacterium]|nr:hypothetical protein [Myxococcales bacterium]